jgi:hypothetical protein
MTENTITVQEIAVIAKTENLEVLIPGVMNALHEMMEDPHANQVVVISEQI